MPGFGPRPTKKRVYPMAQIKAINKRTAARNFGISTKRKKG